MSRIRTSTSTGLFRDVIKGELGDYNLGDVLQFLSTLGKTGQLVIEGNGGLSGGIYVNQGRVVHAVSPVMSGVAAFYELMVWDDGRFAFISDAEPDELTISEELPSLLLEAMRQLDEYRSLLSRLPPLSTELSRQYDNRLLADCQLGYHQWRLLEWVDGSRPMSELIELSGPDPQQAIAALLELFEKGLVTVVSDTKFLDKITVRRLPAERRANLTRHPVTNLAGHILRLVDGQRTLRDIQQLQKCGEHDFIAVIRRLVVLRWIGVIDGIDLYHRHLA